ncbi:MAG TPA: hypothetical protein VL693_20125 [Vicinamibacterales bacterium]|jgi:protein-S-isoprenylcysteine O-methyltransferase Ste14|nr:hypothetical protein [Vicinamibacterales bacterium]
MSRFGMLVVSVAIVVLVALPLLTLATQFLEQVERLATWSPPQLLALFGGLLVVKLIVLLSLGRMVRRSAE